LILLVVLALPSIGQPRACAGAPDVISAEVRTYDIFIDHKKSGQSTLAVTRYSDGTETASTDAKLSVSWTVFRYVYEFHGQERWHRGRLEQINSRAVDGGRRLSLAAMRTGHGLAVSKQGGPAAAIPDVQTTTAYWSQPAVEPATTSLKILDADNGKIYEARFQCLGQEELTISSRPVACSRCRLSGGVAVELWFDAQGLLVRQVGMEDGHHTELRLISIQQPTPALATRLP